MIVTLVRKPLEGSVIANSVAWGSAGVNVDGCRITTAEILTGGGGKLWSHYRDSTEERASPQVNAGLGRFPANLIMTHLAGCQWLGTVKVKGTRTDTRPEGDGGRKDRTEYRIRPTDQTRRDYSDPDGKESVESWQCEPGCPVKGLDKQSGILAPAGGPKHTTHAEGMFGIGQPGVTYKDTGGASRFYKNLKL